MKAKKFICLYELHSDGDGYVSSKVIFGRDFITVCNGFSRWCKDKGFIPVTVIDASYRKETVYCINF